MGQETEYFPTTPSSPPSQPFLFFLFQSCSVQVRMGKISESHRPGGHITSLALPPGNLYNTPLSPPAGIFKTHHCHLLQVDLQHITVTSCRYLYNTSLSPPAGIFTSHRCHLLQVDLQHITVTSCRYLYNTSLSPPPGRFSAHHCHLLQVSFRHITVTSCRYLYNTSLPPSPAPGAVRKTTLYWWRVYYQWGYLV